MRNDARPIGEEFRDIAEHQPMDQAHDREPATREGDERGKGSDESSRKPRLEPPPDASER
jgi:hypothetical protein